MIQVGFAWPDGTDYGIPRIQLVEPGAVDVVHHKLIDIVPEALIPLRVALIPRGGIQRGRSVDTLGQRPMHAVAHHGGAFPISGVAQPGMFALRTRPTVKDRPIEEIRRAGYQMPTGGVGDAHTAQGVLRDEPRPLDAMPRSCPIGFELIVPPVIVEFQQSFPVIVEMFGNPPMVAFRPRQDPGDDSSRSFTLFLLMQDIRERQKRFDGVHIRVKPTIRIQLGKVIIPGIDCQPFIVVPEPLHEYVD
jgi:hypothetical protein